MVFAFHLRMKNLYPGDYIKLKLFQMTYATQKIAIIDHFLLQTHQEVIEDPHLQVK